MGIKGYTCHSSGLPDSLNRPVQMLTSFVMHSDHVSSGFAETVDIPVGIHDHEMHIHRLFRATLYMIQHREAEGNIRDEQAIHDIEMQPVGFTPVHHRYGFIKVKEVGGK
jgi:hypothetical protein